MRKILLIPLLLPDCELVEIQVEVPTELNERQKELVMRLAEELGEAVQPQRRTFMEKLRGLFSD